MSSFNEILLKAKGDFSKKVSVLFVANIVTHIITLINLTLIARVFTLDTVGEYSVMLSYLSIVGNYCILSYNIAIQNSKDKQLPYYVTGSVFVVLITSVFTYIALATLDVNFTIIICILMFLAGLNLISDSINIRDGEMYKIALRKILNPFMQLIFYVSCYFLIEDQLDVNYLLAGIMVAYITTVVLFSQKIIAHFNIKLGVRNLFDVMKARLTKSSLLSVSDLLNTLAYNLPTILIDKYFGAVYAGFYSIVIKICSIPITLISDAIAKVYLNKVLYELRNYNDKISYSNFKHLNIFMCVSSFVGWLFILVGLPSAVTIVLGDAWAEAGTFGLILSPLFCLGYLVTPLSMIFYPLKKEKEVFKLQLAYFMISLFSFLLGGLFSSIYISLWVFSIVSSIRYVYIYFKLMQFAKENSY